MKMYRVTFQFITLVACVLAESLSAATEGVLYEGFGDYHRSITTESAKAQRLFDQGMQLMYGFNHDEAIRSFHAAAEADPSAAMPWWGIAYSHGVNINDPEMTEERSKRAREASDHALDRLIGANPVEVALVKAVSERYEYPAPEDRSGLDQAFADAMQAAYNRFPDDPEVGDALRRLADESSAVGLLGKGWGSQRTDSGDCQCAGSDD